MKIAFITPFPPYRGGISKHSENLYNVFKKKHHISIYNFKRQYPNFLFPGKSQYLKNYNSSNSYRIIDSINPLTWKKTSKKIIANRYDILIIRYWHPFFIPCYNAICKQVKSKNTHLRIYAICDNIVPHEAFFFQKFLLKIFLNNLNGVITMSKNVDNELKELNSNIKSKCLFLPILDDLPPIMDYNESRTLLKLEKNKNIFLFFGLVREYKGIDILLKSISKLKNTKLLIVGECYEKTKKYYELIKQYNIEKNVIWIDEYISDSEISKYFSASDYVILPYRTASQSAIIPMAYNYNKPVVASNIDGIKDQVIDGKTGYLFESESVDSLSKLLLNLSNDKNYGNLIDNIISYKSNFTTLKLAEGILDFIDA